MKLKIEIYFEDNNGLDMEKKLNKAIEDFSKALIKKGCVEMNLIGQEMVQGEIKDFYEVEIKKEE